MAIYRKPCKYVFINLLVALTWHPARPRSVSELKQLGQDLGPIIEWTVAQEIWRRRCITNPEGASESFYFWQSTQHEIDFVLTENEKFIEVKAGKEVETNFVWFLKGFPKSQLTVINQNRFESDRIQGITLEDFLLH